MPTQPQSQPQPKKLTPGFYLRFRGQTTGPYSLEQVKEAITQGTVSRLHDVSRDQSHWFPIHTHPAILNSGQPTPAAQNAASTAAPSANSSSSDLGAMFDAPVGDALSQSPPSTTSDPDTADLIDSILKEPHK